MSARAGELQERLGDVRERLRGATERAGRDVGDVTLVVVTKTWPASDIEVLQSLGVRDIGESRHQEARDKVRALRSLDLNWHFVGQVQTNKAAKIAEYADVVHSVDSSKVAERLAAGAHRGGRPLSCFVQVDLEPAASAPRRGGVPADDEAALREVCDAVGRADLLRLVGVMAVPPIDAEPSAAYAALASVSERVRRLHPQATAVSGGMSGDFEAAVEAGATHVRVGSAILGKRPPLG